MALKWLILHFCIEGFQKSSIIIEAGVGQIVDELTHAHLFRGDLKNVFHDVHGCQGGTF